MKVLFIGNSYTYYNDMPSIFEKLCIDNGKIVQVNSVTVGGRKLYQNLEPTDEKALVIKQLIANNQYDILFLQEQSYLPLVDYDTFEKGILGLVDLIKPKHTIFYATWGRKTGCELLSKLSMTSEQMANELFKAYSNVAKICNAELSPVGLCFNFINQNYPNLDLYRLDLSHPSIKGSTLATLTHYVKAFNEFPKNFTSLEIKDDELSIFKQAINQFIN